MRWGESKGGDIDVSSICDYGFSEFLDKLDGIINEESECAILVLAILVTMFFKEMYTHFDLHL